MLRRDLRFALINKQRTVHYSRLGQASETRTLGWIGHGVTQRHKKYISIGCMRFVGENRTKLIRWAKGVK